MGLVIGFLLFIAKLGSFMLFIPKNWRKWIHKHPFVQGCLDLLLAFSAMHVITIAGGSLVAMIAMVTFGVLSMIYIYTHIMLNKLSDTLNKKNVYAR